MAEQSIKSLFNSAEKQRKAIEESWDTNTATFQQNIAATIETYSKCLRLAERLSLFSPNETLEDITSGDLQYLPINYRLGELILRVSNSDRKNSLAEARDAFERYLTLLDHYEILSAADKKLYKTYVNAPTKFSTISTTDPNARRGAKIANFQQEKELKKKLEVRLVHKEMSLGVADLEYSSKRKTLPTSKMMMMQSANYNSQTSSSAHIIPSNLWNL
jgi:immunoglobulin-binding protein 1